MARARGTACLGTRRLQNDGLFAGRSLFCLRVSWLLVVFFFACMCMLRLRNVLVCVRENTSNDEWMFLVDFCVF